MFTYSALLTTNPRRANTLGGKFYDWLMANPSASRDAIKAAGHDLKHLRWDLAVPGRIATMVGGLLITDGDIEPDDGSEPALPPTAEVIPVPEPIDEIHTGPLNLDPEATQATNAVVGQLTDRFYDWCVNNYENGWADFVVETMSRAELEEMLAKCATMKTAQAKVKKHFAPLAEQRRAQQAA